VAFLTGACNLFHLIQILKFIPPHFLPGHHAERGEGAGFCIFNNVAVAAAAACAEYGLERVVVVDYDVHHGNGTQVCAWLRA